ncbi:MAG: 3-oxoacyl-ACP synthase III [Candidatus Hydrogenedentota bacterium]
MNYSRVHVASIGYELAPVVVSSEELEERLGPVYEALHFSPGQLEALTGIAERRWWEREYPVSAGAAVAARKAMSTAGVGAGDIGAVLYTGVNREQYEPATACRVAAELGIGRSAAIYDISNACLGVLNGMLDVANRIELGQIRAGLVVSCETAREINETMIERMIEDRSMEFFTKSLATLTGGSGAAAVLLTDESLAGGPTTRLLGGVIEAAPEHHALCRWGLAPEGNGAARALMYTDAPSVLRHGVELGKRTWARFLDAMGWTADDLDKVICHQVGQANKDSILRAIGVPEEKDFSTYEFLGNMGTVSLPITAALAAERGFLERGDRVGFLGIGSGLNCMMLGLAW